MPTSRPDCEWLRVARVRFPELLRLHNPGTRHHLVRFYLDDTFVLANVAYLAGEALAAGTSVVIVATQSHLHQISERLSVLGLDLEDLRNAGRYVVADAQEALSQFMIDGSPDDAAFDQVIGGTVGEAAKHSANDFVFAFGEMVALLCADNNPYAAIRLEQLWNRLAQRQRFSLFCAYPLSSLQIGQNADAVTRICAEHDLTVPAEGSLWPERQSLHDRDDAR